MVSLWGSKNGEDEHVDHDDAERLDGDDNDGTPRSSSQRARRNPDERTRLLPPRSDGYLDPDDPAVSPIRCFQIASDLIFFIRSRPTIYGVSEPYATSASSSLSSASYGGCYYWSPSSSAHR